MQPKAVVSVVQNAGLASQAGKVGSIPIARSSLRSQRRGERRLSAIAECPRRRRTVPPTSYGWHAKSSLLCNQHRRLVIGRLCFLLCRLNARLRFFCTHPKRRESPYRVSAGVSVVGELGFRGATTAGDYGSNELRRLTAAGRNDGTMTGADGGEVAVAGWG